MTIDFRVSRARWTTASRIVAFALVALLTPGLAAAQATRTWVSGVGDDANPCSRTAPCKTFQGTISKTAAGGTINVLDPGGFGAVSITKSLTIEADGALAGILLNTAQGIIINAGANDVVMLRNLRFQGLNTANNAIRVLSAKTVVLDGIVIEGFADHGVDIEPTGPMQISLRNVTVRNTEAAIFVRPNVAAPNNGSVALTARDVQLVENQFGIEATGPATLAVRDSDILSSTNHGVYAIGGASAVSIALDRVSVRDSLQNGLFADGANAEIRATGSEISANAQGVLTAGGGIVISHGGNRLVGNVVNGAFSQTVPTQ
jgi:hypothetical protein